MQKKKNVFIVDHPLIEHKLTITRNRETGTKSFYENVNEIAGLMAFEITRDLKLKDVEIETPIARTTQKMLAQEAIIIPILRAGMGMMDGVRAMIPNAKIGHIGIYRDEETLEAREYFAKFPEVMPEGMVLLLDPMLATGVSAAAAIRILKNHGAKTIKLVCIVGAPEGVSVVHEEHPEIDIYLASLDDGLNEDAYIIPGLGDAGDRLFGTK